MRHPIRRLALVLALGMLAGGAAQGQSPPEQGTSQPARGNSQLTPDNVQMNLRIGKTRKSDVLEVFGAPNLTTRNASGVELWSYQRYARVVQSELRSDDWTVFVGNGGSGADTHSETTRTLTLVIRFDQNDVVSDFRSRTSEF